MASLYDRTLQESTLFELFKANAYTDTIKALKLAQTEIINKINSIKGDTWSKRRLTTVRKLINQEIAKAYSGTLPLLQNELPGIVEITAKNMLLTNFTKVPVSVINTITSNTFEIQGYPAKKLFKTISDNHTKQLQVLVGSGVAQGKPTKTIVNELVAKHSALSKPQLRNAVFTTITEARAVSRHASYKQLEKSGIIIGYEYVSTLDSHTSEYCRNHDNRKYYQNIDEIESEINVHFHCRSVFVPLTKTSKFETRASEFGPVLDESYSQWFSKQSDQFKKSVLGKKKFESYINGGYKVGGLADVTGKALTLSTISSILNTTAKEINISNEEN